VVLCERRKLVLHVKIVSPSFLSAEFWSGDVPD